MPRILADPRLINIVWMTAIDIVNQLRARQINLGQTEVFPGPEGMIIVCLLKKSERTPEILEEIKSTFEEASEKAQIYAKVEVIDSDEKDWHKII